MKEFKITEQKLQQIVNILSDVQGKYCVPIIDLLRNLEEIKKEIVE